MMVMLRAGQNGRVTIGGGPAAGQPRAQAPAGAVPGEPASGAAPGEPASGSAARPW
jgi:hypothetical protein